MKISVPLQRLLRIAMRITVTQFILACFFYGFAMAHSLHAQEVLAQEISMQVESVEVIQILNQLEKQAGVKFVYSSHSIQLPQRASLKAQGKPLCNVLNELFEPLHIQYEVIGSRILLQRKLMTDRNIRGLVTDEKGEPMPGVSIVLKDTKRGMITDTEGRFSFEIPNENSVLVFSFVGYISEEVVVGNKTTIVVSLKEDKKSLGEVMVVGYGTIKKEAVTGAVSKANLDLYKDVPTNNILESIKGSIAGLNVGGVNSAGEVASLSIRGQKSTAASNTPLIVVDGVIYYGSLADIAPSDIESLTVLKDASAAATFGSRSANGVIIITTKKGGGLNGKPKFDIRVNYGISSQLVPMKLYDAEGYIKRLLDIRQANGQEADPAKVASYLEVDESTNYNATSDHKPTLTDPFNVIGRPGNIVSANINVSNSTDKTNYYLSTTLLKQKGIVINDDFKQISGRVNMDSDLTNWLTMGIRGSYSLLDYSGDIPSMYWATMFSPYASVYNDDGTYRQYPQSTGAFVSPFWQIATEDSDRRHNLSALVSGLVKVPWVEGLKYTVNFSNSYRIFEKFSFYDKNTTEGDVKNGTGSRQYETYFNMLFDNFLSYSRKFQNKHSIDATLLLSREHYSYENTSAYAENFENTRLGSYALSNGTIHKVTSGGGETNSIGLMARGTYSYAGKYSITGTIRRDGYSAFSRDKKWGTFPSAGLNWNISKEAFMDNVKVINNLALRLSFGTNGNQSISPYQSLARISTSKYVLLGDNGNYTTTTQYISSLANNNLSWETTTGTNMGVDFSVLGDRLGGSIELYKTKTSNLMFELPIPTTSGMTSILSNVGEIRNSGVEINLNSVNINRDDFKWSSDFAFSLNRNKVVSILGDDSDGDGIEDDLINAGYFIGKPIGTIYDYKITGIYQQSDADAGKIMSGLRVGDYSLEDVNGDGAITSDKDRQFIGNQQERFRWSLTNTFKYRSATLMVYLYSIWGGNNWYLYSNSPYLDSYVNHTAVNRPVYDYWTASNTNAQFPRPDYSTNAAYQGVTYMDRSFVKLQKISLSYDFTKIASSLGINGLKVAISGDNLFTYAPHWLGLDPETNSGLSNQSKPSIRTWLLSVSLNF